MKLHFNLLLSLTFFKQRQLVLVMISVKLFCEYWIYGIYFVYIAVSWHYKLILFYFSGNVQSLKALNLRNCPLQFPPSEVVNLGTQVILSFLREQACKPLLQTLNLETGSTWKSIIIFNFQNLSRQFQKNNLMYIFDHETNCIENEILLLHMSGLMIIQITWDNPFIKHQSEHSVQHTIQTIYIL